MGRRTSTSNGTSPRPLVGEYREGDGRATKPKPVYQSKEQAIAEYLDDLDQYLEDRETVSRYRYLTTDN